MVYPIVGYIDYKPIFFPDAREVQQIFEVNFFDFVNKANMTTSKINVRGQYMSVPGFSIQNQWVWGATALIFNEMVDIWNTY
jgi:hypothetical protein